MQDKTAQQLQQDAQKLQQLAASRLDAMDFKAQLDAQMKVALSDKKSAQKPRLNRSPWLAAAAAIALTAMAWLFLQQPVTVTEVGPIEPVATAQKTLQLDLRQWPRAVESQVNQPLLDEQQAIIADLKALKSRLLSI